MTHVAEMANSGASVTFAPAAASHLFSPKAIGGVRIPNRIVMAPMTTRAADENGFVTDDTLAYYDARAEGGVGLVTIEMASPELVGRHRRRELGIHDDRFLPGLERLAGVLHRRGAKVAIQLGHGGGHTRADVAGGTPVAPSAVPHTVEEGHTETIVPEAMTAGRIDAMIGAFVDAAIRASTAGIDIVEIHAAHGYLLSQFLAPAENRRDDAYGGPLANRARPLLEIVQRIKARLPGLPVIVRLNGDDFFEGGMTSSEALEVAVRAAQAGADALHMTGGHYRSTPSPSIMIPPMARSPGIFVPFAAAVRERVEIPVIAVGRLGDPRQAEAVITRGDADFVALGRPLLADPAWAKKVKSGRPVRMCIACNSCVDGMRSGGRLHCLVNAAAGRERRFGGGEAGQRLAVTGRRIAVVGAGPAGLTYASLAARGNRVTVFEREPTSGGALRLAGRVPSFQNVAADDAPILAYVEALEADCRAREVAFRFASDPVERPDMLGPFDLVVVATGARYRPGLDRLLPLAIRSGLARRRPFSAVAGAPRVRSWFHDGARRPDDRLEKLLRAAGRRSVVIGDARVAGKAADAVMSAFAAALVDGDAGGNVQ